MFCLPKIFLFIAGTSRTLYADCRWGPCLLASFLLKSSWQYRGTWWPRLLYTSIRILNSILCWIGSQCRLIRHWLLLSYFDLDNINLAGLELPASYLSHSLVLHIVENLHNLDVIPLDHAWLSYKHLELDYLQIDFIHWTLNMASLYLFVMCTLMDRILSSQAPRRWLESDLGDDFTTDIHAVALTVC